MKPSAEIRGTDNTITQVDAPGSFDQPTYFTALNGINASGTVVGTFNTVSAILGFLRTSDGTMTVIDPPDTGGAGSSAIRINNSGVIAGYFYDDGSLDLRRSLPAS